MEHSISRVLDFWFDARHEAAQLWFRQDPTIDQKINEDFGELVQQARTSALDAWTNGPQGTLAMLILLDQFPRNIFRGSPESWSSDAKALDVSAVAISKGYDTQVTPVRQTFFYTPFMHNESLIGQIASVALYEGFEQRCEPGSPAKAYATKNLRYAKMHRDVIAKFGRFPSRNDVLGRESTEEERTFLGEHPGGF
ncbi:hypothetical protein P7C71_g2902, partial [Lecanoromycetidae sp. Uapishka_2]